MLLRQQQNAYKHGKKKVFKTLVGGGERVGKKPHLDRVFKITAIQKLIPNLKITFWINMRGGEKAPKTTYA